jgi:hypothetical protein
MNRTICLTALAAMAASCNALAVGGIAEVTIIDRDSGATLTPYLSHGEYWVAGKPGATYAIAIHNHLDERLLAVTSVDGVNVLSGDTAAWNQTGYVFRPQQAYQITGWRKSDDVVAAFTFTASPNSYAARTGRPANVGIIGVAVFRERQQPQVFTPPPPPAPTSEPMMPAPALADASPSSRSRSPATLPEATTAAPKLGTGHGEREYSHVENTEFQRRQTQPDEIIRIRYDSLDNLIAMGIVTKSRPVIPVANPFPDSPQQQYVPDPPARGREDSL